jgi:hypothetical protein
MQETVGANQVAKRAAGTVEALEDLQRATCALEEAAVHLRERLRPISLGTPPRDAKGAPAPDRPVSDYASAMNGLAERIWRVKNLIDDTDNALDL